MHDHNECDHDLKYCGKCDVVYCKKCRREWGGHYHYYWTTPYYTQAVKWNGSNTITVSNTGIDGQQVAACSHSEL